MTNEEIKPYYHGAYRFEETEDGYLHGIQYTAEQLEYLKTVRTDDFFYTHGFYGNAKTLEFVTEATEVSFDYRFLNGGNETVDLAVDGIVYETHRVSDMEKSGRITFKLKAGKKRVVIYLTADNVTYIKNLEINAPAEPIVKKTKVLWMGDSITQGYGCFKASETYVSVANRILDYEVLNQGIGGYYYDKNILTEMPGYKPDKIIIAHGTNQSLAENREQAVKEYYDRLEEVYPNIPVLTLTPVWRGLFSSEYDAAKLAQFVDFCGKIKAIAEKYPNVTVIDGFTLMHHDKEYYMPDWLHPNALGCEVYGNTLARKIQELGF